MLSTSNLSAAQAETYYTREDYYSAEETAHPTKWVGKGAASLGLAGIVNQQEFSQMLSGQAPDGRSLKGKVVAPEKRRAATDFTFSAPKSVSIAALVQQDARVLEAHHQAVAKALSVLEERYAQTRISTEAGRTKVTTGNIAAAVFTHSTSREAEPQLHSHCVVMNATQLDDGRWFSLSNEGAIANQKLLGQIYQNELAVALKQQGYGIEPKPHGQFELAGYSPDLLKAFSTRRQQILKLIEEWEATGSENNRTMRETATLVSRKRKPKEVDEGLLQRGWNALIQLKGLELPELPEGATQTVGDQPSVYSTIDAAIQHCGERESVFRRTTLERFVFEHELGAQEFEAIEGAIADSPELIKVADGKFTTQTALNLELNTIRLMQQGRGQVAAIVPNGTQLDSLVNHSLNPEQKNAVEMAATTPDAVMAWQGVAGAGKTYALSVLKELAQGQGYDIRGLAPSAEAAHVLGESLGIETTTVAGRLVSDTPDQAPQPTLWIVDEAGLLSMKDAHALLRRAALEQARVLLVGDTRQLSAVEAGNPFKSLQAGGMTTAYLRTHRRQQTGVLRSVVEFVSQGQISEGIEILAQAGFVKEGAQAQDRIQQVAADYLALAAEDRESTLVLAGTNAERLALTQVMRSGLQDERALGADGFVMQSLRRKDLTTAQASYLKAYAPGDVLVPIQDYRKQGLLRGEQYRVIAVNSEAQQVVLETPNGSVLSISPAACPRKTVYATQSIPIAVGDRLRWTRNNPKAGIRNGQGFVVTGLESDGTATIRDGSGQIATINLSGNQYIDYAWVSTTYSSQGKTAERVLALLGETTNREAFYVAISRAKRAVTLYTTSQADLVQLAQVSRAKENVSDYMPLTQQVMTYGQHEQQEQRQPEPIPGFDPRAVGERIGQRVAEQFRAAASRDLRQHAAGVAPRRSRPDLGRGFGNATPALESELGVLGRAIAAYRQRRDLFRCAGDLAGAVAAVNRGLEQLERAAQDRAEVAAAVDRLARAAERQNRRQRETKYSGVLDVEGSSRFIEVNTGSEGEIHSPPPPQENSNREQYYQMWQQYSQKVSYSNAAELDFKVGHQAFEAGVSQKEIALMLVAGSPTVKHMMQEQRKLQAMKYVNRVAQLSCQGRQQHIQPKVFRQHQLEIGD
ncbi:relaxase domain-containing protein [Nodosilinea sp. LEGE 07088]|uniref:MobF family relaxase n=1 Tax=Nodosilinea sp. LEGE 07088 TaxID=2777968 RepID=UPI001882F41B|nr:MobF family relaxase [Nodosilinea sp. LEGE 07088]MBE9137035.1 relaxase domain-containing protein [Nodosilinea sp. LEGE 07088]